MSEKMLELGSGLELWRVPIDELKEQDINARVMNKSMFDRLASTIARDDRLESLPLCAATPRGIEVISGHHRVRAARVAGLREIFAIVDVTGLTRSQIAAKQLAHNAIQGEDDRQMLARIYESIEDVQSKLESYVDPKDIDAAIYKTPIPTMSLAVDYQTALVTFLPSERTRFDRACEQIERIFIQKADVVYLADLAMLGLFKDVIRRIGRDYEVRSLGTIFSTMAELALAQLGEPLEDTVDDGFVPLVELFGCSTVPSDVAEAVRDVLAALESEQIVTAKTRFMALARWAEMERGASSGAVLPSGNGRSGGEAARGAEERQEGEIPAVATAEG